MGSYAELKLGSLCLSFDKSEVNLIMTLFRESDKRISKNDKFDSEDDIAIMKYSASVSAIKDRLDLMGFTRKFAENDFYNGLKERIAQNQDWRRDTTITELLTLYNLNLSILQGLTLETWSSSLQTIIQNNLSLIRPSDPQINNYSPLVRYMLSSENYFGFPGNEYRNFLRLLLEIFPDTDLLEYDLTDLLANGYINESDNLVEYTDNLISQDFLFSKKIIVLTEGKTDKWILQRSLKLLYPHLYDYYYFLDFYESKVEGGAGALANTIKSFVGAGIINRVIALFDNDTAAESAIQSLKTVNLPNNIVIRQYPNLSIGISYPTQGPTGITSMNINGLAGSVELYLGSDILMDSSKTYAPIQWNNYDSRLRKYQGEITNKIELQNKFKQKLKDCELNPNILPKYDWTGLQAIFDIMRNAFHTDE